MYSHLIRLLLLVPCFGLTLEINIKAERTEADLRQGQIRYLEQVVATQDGMRLEADTLLVFLEGQQIRELQALGQPAVLNDWRDPENPIEISALELTVWPLEDRYQAKQQAKLEHPEVTLTAEQLIFEQLEQILKAQGQTQTILLDFEAPSWLANSEQPSDMIFNSDQLTWWVDEQRWQLIGNVSLEQQSLTLIADDFLLEVDDFGINHFLANGQPAQSSALLEGEELPLYLDGEQLSYHRDPDRLLSQRDASLKQLGYQQQADRMTFFIDEQRSQGEGNVRLQILEPQP